MWKTVAVLEETQTGSGVCGVFTWQPFPAVSSSVREKRSCEERTVNVALVSLLPLSMETRMWKFV